MRILLIGGTGVFGSRLARGLRGLPGVDLRVAGRGADNDVILDRTAPDLSARIAAEAPGLVIDAAGPFQLYDTAPYAVAEAAIGCGAHYLDLSDATDFTCGIAGLDAAAKAAGVTVLSGVSSVPAISSAAVEALRDGIDDIHLIESVLVPGNQAPRGLSVMRAILAQAGRPLTLWRAGRAETHAGWSGLRRHRLQGLGPRWSSLIGAPDLALFPDHYGARSVDFRAGLELTVMHLGLWAASLPVRWGWLKSLEPLARPMRWLAGLFQPFGTDRGGMRVRLVGRGAAGAMCRDWSIFARDGDGPHIPALPARVMVARLMAGQVAPGARACLGEFTLDELMACDPDLAIWAETADAPQVPVFKTVLGKAWADLPPPLQDLHDVLADRRWTGTARVDRGAGRLARLVCRVMRFPPASDATPVTVTMHRRGGAETWVRHFGDHSFQSVLKPGSGGMTERFGLLTFTIALTVVDGRLTYPVTAGRCGPVPIPRALLPRSEAVEAVDGTDVTFDVNLSLPLVGPLVRYRGRLRPEA